MITMHPTDYRRDIWCILVTSKEAKKRTIRQMYFPPLLVLQSIPIFVVIALGDTYQPFKINSGQLTPLPPPCPPRRIILLPLKGMRHSFRAPCAACVCLVSSDQLLLLFRMFY